MSVLSAELSPIIESISGSLSSMVSLSGNINSLPGTLSAELKNIGNIEIPTYEDETEITPSTEMQVLNTAQKLMINNITVNPIPSNYGLIIWDGSALTVK